jgi:hypothetical protein
MGNISCRPAERKPACAGGWSGNVLFSQGATPQVSSGPKGLTTVFGMGTGVSLSLESPPHPHVHAGGHMLYSFLIGGDEGIRTPDLCRARAALFQLSYIPALTTGWAFLDSNQGPQSYQDCALTT